MKLEEQKSYQSWTLSDEFWDKVSWLIPKYQRDSTKEYKRKAGGGRKPPDYRKILAGIFYMLRTGCQWKAMPGEFCKGSNNHRYFQLWEQAGFFEVIWAYALEEYDDLIGIDWEWQSIDGCMTKAPLAQVSVGKIQRIEGKRYKTQIINRRTWAPNSNLCLDAGYIGHDDEIIDRIIDRMYIHHIRPRGEEKLLIERNPDYKPRRWVVEVTNSWINRFRKLLVRFEKKPRRQKIVLSH